MIVSNNVHYLPDVSDLPDAAVAQGVFPPRSQMNPVELVLSPMIVPSSSTKREDLSHAAKATRLFYFPAQWLTRNSKIQEHGWLANFPPPTTGAASSSAPGNEDKKSDSMIATHITAHENPFSLDHFHTNPHPLALPELLGAIGGIERAMENKTRSCTAASSEDAARSTTSSGTTTLGDDGGSSTGGTTTRQEVEATSSTTPPPPAERDAQDVVDSEMISFQIVVNHGAHSLNQFGLENCGFLDGGAIGETMQRLYAVVKEYLFLKPDRRSTSAVAEHPLPLPLVVDHLHEEEDESRLQLKRKRVRIRYQQAPPTFWRTTNGWFDLSVAQRWQQWVLPEHYPSLFFMHRKNNITNRCAPLNRTRRDPRWYGTEAESMEQAQQMGLLPIPGRPNSAYVQKPHCAPFCHLPNFLCALREKLVFGDTFGWNRTAGTVQHEDVEKKMNPLKTRAAIDSSVEFVSAYQHIVTHPSPTISGTDCTHLRPDVLLALLKLSLHD
ncbi:unnamed protein product [Amoebophrya sp. A120]|nr:unnamed protein product [Amoebophrya sp. A120]|eukprot:GSA120T00011892001.1